MKRFLKIICVILVIAMIMAVPVAAETEATPRASLFFGTISTYLYQVSSTRFQVWFDVVAVERMEVLGVSSIQVQRSSDATNWTTMLTYHTDVNPDMLAYNTVSHGACVSYTGTQGYYYRALVTFYAKNSVGAGKLQRYTQTIQL